jgi:hypothetical protein
MEYELISSSPTLAHIHFSGVFNNKKIVWDAEIRTLKSTVQENLNSNVRQYIEIINNSSELMPISIGLNVNAISIPEILKVIIMITNYKNLCIGRHEFGETFSFKNK